MIADVCPVPDSPWFLVARMDISEVYTTLRKKYWEILILIGALMVGAGAGVGFVWKNQCSRYYHYRDKHQSAETVRERESRFRLLVDGVKDYAIFILNREGKVVSWNEGAEPSKGIRRRISSEKFSPVFIFPATLKTKAAMAA